MGSREGWMTLGQGLMGLGQNYQKVTNENSTMLLEQKAEEAKSARLAHTDMLTFTVNAEEREIQQSQFDQTKAFQEEKFNYTKTQDTIKNEQTRLNNQYHKVPVTKYGWVEETELVKDELTGENKEKITSKWKPMSSGMAFVDKRDSANGFVIDASGNRSPLGSSEYQATPPPKDGSGKSMPFSEYRRQYEIENPDIDMSIEGNAAKLRALGIRLGYTFTKEPTTPPPVDDSFSWDSPKARDDFNEEEFGAFKDSKMFKRLREEIDEHIKGKMLSGFYGMVYKNERIIELAKEYKVSPEEMAGLLGYVVDEDDIDIETESAQAPPSGPATDPQPLPAGIISAPPTEEQQKNLEILESLKKQGLFGNKVTQVPPSTPSPVTSAFGTNASGMEDASASAGGFPATGEPEVVNLAPVGQIATKAPTDSDTPSNKMVKSAKEQVSKIIAAMEAANIPKEVIRKELLRLLGLIKPEDSESRYARALADAYVEFTKEAN